MATRETTHDRTLFLGPDDDGRSVTAEEFAAASYKEPWRYERVRGKLVVLPRDGEVHACALDTWIDSLCLDRHRGRMAPDGQAHDQISGPWRDYLGAYRLDRRAIVDLVVSEAWMRIDSTNDRIADLGVYLTSGPPTPTIPDRVPDLVFEIVSPGRESRRRDYVAKKSEYLRFGVGEYVIIDQLLRRVTIYSRGAGGHYLKRIVRPPDAYTTDLLPGLAIPLDEVLGS